MAMICSMLMVSLLVCCGTTSQSQDASTASTTQPPAAMAKKQAAFPTVAESEAAGAGSVPLPTDTAERQFMSGSKRKVEPGENLPAGLVSLRILVSQTGVVTGITPLKTTATPLVQPAIDWVKTWRFRTFQLQKSTVRFTTVVIVQVTPEGKFEAKWQ